MDEQFPTTLATLRRANIYIPITQGVARVARVAKPTANIKEAPISIPLLRQKRSHYSQVNVKHHNNDLAKSL
jgi:hypothetical protein